VVPAEEAGGWVVLGMVENLSTVTAGEVWLKVSLLGSGGVRLGEQETMLALPHLGPGETAPFSASFAAAGAASGATAEVLRYLPAQFERVGVTVAGLTSSSTNDGRMAVVGKVINGSDGDVDLHEIAIVAADADGAPLALAPAAARRTRLEAGAEAPFLALLPSTAEGAALTAYADATAISSPQPPRLTLTSAPVVLEDEQGDPFVLGVIRNGDSRPRIASVLVSLENDDEVVGVAQIVTPIPLGPGESRPFTATEFPGLASTLGAGSTFDELHAQAWVDPPTEEEPDLRVVPLTVQLTSYEAIGGTLFLRGRVANDSGESVVTATVLVAVRSVEGIPLTAGWKVAAEALEPGATADFVVELALPQGTDLALSEYDVVADALAPG
jgi:hypothetical protein